MSRETQELIRICEQLPEAQRLEVADFARFLLARAAGAGPRRDAADRWLASARGAARPGVTTDLVMGITRREFIDANVVLGTGDQTTADDDHRVPLRRRRPAT